MNKPIDANDTTITKGPLEIGIQKAILLAMENNRSLVVERMNPEISRTFEEEELAIFDPLLGAEVSNRRTVADRLSRAGTSTESQTVDSVTGLISVSKLFPTGTSVGLQGSTSYTDSSLYSDTFTSNRLGFTVTQALLQGMDICANLARIHQARIESLISEYELRGFMEVLLEEVESKFWDYALAQRQIEIYTNSLNLAEKQMDEVQERINIGQLAETELAAAQAEVALRRENLINARSDLAKERLNLLRLLNPSQNINWNRDIILEYQTSLPSVELDDVEQHVQVALKMRPELNQARLQMQQGDLEVIKTKNGLLPKMDFFIAFGKTGYADTFNRSTNNIFGDSYDVTGGLIFEYPPINQSARARYSRAVISRRQLLEALKNLTQLIQVDVRSAYIEATRTSEQIAATAATSNFQEEKLRTETEKFRVGKSTSLLVAQAQRDLLASQIAEIQAVANYLKALVGLYRLEGSLLQRRGISAPGIKPISPDSEK
ncbi:MAG TPA: TolC family protein [Sedimentisphaerales bacterium]|nr:TolC family protein [Sedimentisphaerales bacterium]